MLPRVDVLLGDTSYWQRRGSFAGARRWCELPKLGIDPGSHMLTKVAAEAHAHSMLLEPKECTLNERDTLNFRSSPVITQNQSF